MAKVLKQMTSPEPDRIVGIIFPLFEEHIRRFFDEDKTVFVKFIASDLTHIHSGHRLFFYRSKGNKEVVGEARIVDIASKTANEALATYGDRLFLTAKELREYVRDRNAKNMLVLVLDHFKKYPVPLRLDKSVTMAGQYMRQSLLSQLRNAPQI